MSKNYIDRECIERALVHLYEEANYYDGKKTEDPFYAGKADAYHNAIGTVERWLNLAIELSNNSEVVS